MTIVTDEMVEAAARVLSGELSRWTWEELQDYPISLGKYTDLARRVLTAAFAPHQCDDPRSIAHMNLISGRERS